MQKIEMLPKVMKMVNISNTHLPGVLYTELLSFSSLFTHGADFAMMRIVSQEKIDKLALKPADLHYICVMSRWAENNGYDWILFDRHGDIVEELPMYEWGE
jgi:hypothetical protein